MLFRLVILSVLLLLCASQTAPAQTLTCPQVLDFGKIAACSQTGTVELSPDGNIIAHNCLTAMGGHQVGRCTLSDITDTATITMDVTTTLDGPSSNNVSINQFKLRPVSGGSAEDALIVHEDMAEYGFDFTIGATLHLDPSQPSGDYDGLYTLTVSYE